MIDAQQAGVPVVAVANPGSGPGTEGDRPSYEKGMKALRDAGVEVRCVSCAGVLCCARACVVLALYCARN